MYLLLVTNKQSNILEDLDTLRLLSKVLPEYTQQQTDEEGISRNAFDLIFAFDEVGRCKLDPSLRAPGFKSST